MNARTHMWVAVFAVTLLLCTIIGCQTARQSRDSAFTPETLSGAAYQTYVNYSKAAGTGEEGLHGEIASKYWTKPIKALHPVKVYIHRVNVVVVQKVENGTEEGKYIYIPISSYLPRTGDDGFVFTPNPEASGMYNLGDGAFDFKRKVAE